MCTCGETRTSSDASAQCVPGVTVGIMLVPQSMSYAALAGLPYRYGLYSGLLPLCVYALLGTSHQLQPSKNGSLDVKLLKRIHFMAQEIKEKQTWKAAGVKPTDGLTP